MTLIRLHGVRRTYRSAGRPDVEALRGIDLEISQGEFVAVVGPSGGGKTTLMNILGLLDDATSGTYELEGQAVDAGLGLRAAGIRARTVGFVFQAFHLLENRPATDSVGLNLLYRGTRRPERDARVLRAVAAVGLGDHAHQSASTLSGGQQQRIAIARAIAANPKLVLADEPTGNLDSVNAGLILDELERINRAGATVIVVTHSPEVAARARRVISIVDGELVSDVGSTSPPSADAGISLRAAEGGSANAAPSIPEGGGIRFADMLRDAWASVLSRTQQTLGQSLAVAIAVALTITTLGLSTSARAQVSATFDAHLNREVTATWSTGLSHAPPLVEVPGRVERLNGVDAAAAMLDLEIGTISTFAVARQTRPHLVIGDFVAAARIAVDTASWHDGPLRDGEAYVGDLLADDMQLSSVEGAPTVLVNGRSYVVAGIITASSRLPLLRGEVVVGAPEGFEPGGAVDVTMLAVTAAGAAPQVAGQIPAALDPFQSDTIRVTAPTDSATLRGEVEQGVQVTLTAFTLLALIAAVAALMNATLLSVHTRRGEIGMRKALGARDRQIGALITLESAFIGLVGGVVGLILGMGAILTVTVTQRWAPVFDVALLPVAIAAGLIVGAGGGGLASIRAARLRPAENLRS